MMPWLGALVTGRDQREALAAEGAPISLHKRDPVTYLPCLNGGQTTIPPSPLGPEPMWCNQPTARVHPDCPWDGEVV